MTLSVAGNKDSKEQSPRRGATIWSQRQYRPPKRFEDFQLHHWSGVVEALKKERLNPNITICDCQLQTFDQMARTKNTVCKVSAMYKSVLCIEILQSPEEVLEHVGSKHNNMLRYKYCDYT